MKPKNINTIQLTFRSSAVFHTPLPWEESGLRLLWVLLASVAVGYVTLVSMSIVNVIARKEATDEASSLSTIVGQLERDYFALSQDLTAQSGSSLGLAPVSQTHYVHAPGSVGAVAGAPNEL